MKKLLTVGIVLCAASLFAGDLFACGGGERAGRGRLFGRFRERRAMQGSCSSSMSQSLARMPSNYSSVQYRSVTVTQGQSNIPPRPVETAPVQPVKPPQAPVGNVK